MSLPTSTFYVLLALKNGPSHGVGIADDVAAFTAGDMLLGPGTLYRSLKDLQRQGAIQRVEIDEGPGTGHRKHYTLTPVGEAELNRGLSSLSRVVRVAERRVAGPIPQTSP